MLRATVALPFKFIRGGREARIKTVESGPRYGSYQRVVNARRKKLRDAAMSGGGPYAEHMRKDWKRKEVGGHSNQSTLQPMREARRMLRDAKQRAANRQLPR